MQLRTAFALSAFAAMTAGTAGADVLINEVLGSTTSTDTEFIELYNNGGSAVDLTGWSIELYDSDDGQIGGVDGGSPHVISSGSIAAGGLFLLANPETESIFSVTADAALPANAIENSSYTMLLIDDMDNIIASLFVTDGGAGDTANDGGTTITPDDTVGPDGTFLPAGVYRIGDGGSSWGILEFTPRPAPSATPGTANIPEPGSLALLGLGGLLIARRRRA